MRIDTRDIVAVAVVLVCGALVARGADGPIRATLIGVSAYYFGDGLAKGIASKLGYTKKKK